MLFRESIFVTGFPGFIASRLVERLAHPETQFFLLVQPHLIDEAMAEAEEIAEQTNTPLESFVIVEGDITLPDLGISAEDLDTIRPASIPGDRSERRCGEGRVWNLVGLTPGEIVHFRAAVDQGLRIERQPDGPLR